MQIRSTWIPSRDGFTHGTVEPYGRTVATPNAVASLSPSALVECLRRHASGDWGDLCDEDKALNEEALTARDGRRVFSRYDVEGENLYVITDAPFTDQTVTTALLAEDY